MAALSSVHDNSGYIVFRQGKSVNPDRSPENISSAAQESVQRDRVTLSSEGREKSLDTAQAAAGLGPGKDAAKIQLDRQEIQQLQKLKLRDREVRTHEQAHLSAAGAYARGGMSFTYQKGSDGVDYAIGGEVGIDLGKESTPEATLLKMETIQRAALAPADPSGADRQIAAQAAAKEAEARQEILRKTQEELQKIVTGKFSPYTNAARDKVSGTPSSSSASLRSAIAAYTA